MSEERSLALATEVMLTETATDVHAVAVYDHAHAKESKIAVTITGDHESRVTDQMNMVVGFAYKQGANAKGAAAHEDECPTLRGGQPDAAIGFNPSMGAKACGVGAEVEKSPCLSAKRNDASVSYGFVPFAGGGVSSCVRRLTPEECEALMGYPIGHTKVPYRGKPADACPDGPRYEACGNGWAINCARWVLLGIHHYLFNHQQKEQQDER